MTSYLIATVLIKPPFRGPLIYSFTLQKLLHLMAYSGFPPFLWWHCCYYFWPSTLMLLLILYIPLTFGRAWTCCGYSMHCVIVAKLHCVACIINCGYVDCIMYAIAVGAHDLQPGSLTRTGSCGNASHIGMHSIHTTWFRCMNRDIIIV